MATPFAYHISTSNKSWVFDALWINMQIFSAESEICFVDTVVHLVTFSSSQVVVAHFALKLKEAAIVISFMLFCFEHVVTLRAKSHTLELIQVFFLIRLGRLD